MYSNKKNMKLYLKNTTCSKKIVKSQHNVFVRNKFT